MDGVHRIPVFLGLLKDRKTERIDRKEESDYSHYSLLFIKSSFLFRSIYRKYAKVGYFLACTLPRMCNSLLDSRSRIRTSYGVRTT